VEYKPPASVKKVITHPRRPADLLLELAVERDGASILKVTGSEVVCASGSFRRCVNEERRYSLPG
jgi:hypothetical protein